MSVKGGLFLWWGDNQWEKGGERRGDTLQCVFLNFSSFLIGLFIILLSFKSCLFIYLILQCWGLNSGPGTCSTT
jgi:hypothetical protein